MNNDFYIENNYGQHKALIIRQWTNQCEAFLYDNKLDSIVLNDARGWKGKSIDFLEGIKVKHLHLLTHSRKLKDLNVLSTIKGLKTLSLQTPTNKNLDLTTLPELEECWLNHEKEYESIFACSNLKRLGYGYYPFKDLQKIKRLTNLQSLTLTEGKLKSLSGIEEITNNLTKLELSAFGQLHEYNQLQKLVNLEDVDIYKCKKINNISFVENLLKLRQFKIDNSGDIDTLASFKELKHLELISFDGSTNILDGDLSYLKQIKTLKKIIFEARDHYSHKQSFFFGFVKKR